MVGFASIDFSIPLPTLVLPFPDGRMATRNPSLSSDFEGRRTRRFDDLQFPAVNDASPPRCAARQDRLSHLGHKNVQMDFTFVRIA